jgi:hypothetical protein
MIDKEKEFKEELNNIFKLVIDWIKYAEQKLTGIIVLNLGIIWGYTRLISDVSLINTTYYIVFFGYILLLLSTIYSIIGKMPITQNKFLIFNKIKPKNNILLFEYIKDKESEEYMIELNNKINEYINKEVDKKENKDLKVECIFTMYDKDKTEQIIINSKITSIKFSIANISSKITLIAILLFVIGYALI